LFIVVFTPIKKLLMPLMAFVSKVKVNCIILLLSVNRIRHAVNQYDCYNYHHYSMWNKQVNNGVINNRINLFTLYLLWKNDRQDRLRTQLYDKRDDLLVCGAETANLSGAHEFTLGFLWGSCYSIISFMCSVVFLLAATLNKGNHDRNHMLWNSVSIVRYIFHMQVLLECCYI
jgi:hypothetical protein